MVKTSPANLQNLLSEIETKIAALKSGKLAVTELDALVKLAADLHERLAVVRFKAYEKFGEPQAVQTQISNPVTETAFDLTALESAPEKIIPEEKTEAFTPSFEVDFTASTFETPQTEKPEIPVAQPEVKKSIQVIREEVKPDAASLHEKFLKEDDVDLNDILKPAEEDVPLRKKLGKTPIKDLKSEIGIGKKFEYINFLFAGDAKAYDTAITELNSCSSADSARQKLNVYASVYKWDLEDKTIEKFVELIERRYL